MAECLRMMWGFFKRDLVNEWSTRSSFLFQLLNIGLTVAAYTFLSRLVEKETLSQWAPAEGGYFPFVLIGMATNGAMITALTGLSRSLQLQKSSGMLKALFFSQTRPEVILLLSSIYPIVRAELDLLLYLIVGWSFGGLSIAGANLLGAAALSCLSIIAFGSLGLWAAAFTVLFRFGNPLLWVITSSSWLLGGVLYPTPLLPVSLRWLAQLFPLTHALQGMRATLLYGAPLKDLLLPVAFVGAFIIVAAPLGVVVFNIGLKKARIRGTLDD
jgi:ABC-2 type transport system permease protein